MSASPTSRVLATVIALTLVALVGIAVAVKMLVDPVDDGPPHPEAWDERVLPLIEIVEQTRGLEFKEPVYVDFLSDDEFREDVRTDEEELTDEDREELTQTLGLLRALGLIEGDPDLFDAIQELNAGGVLAYYTYQEERIRIRGSELTPAITSTVVHELTHALQDQHFDLGARLESFGDDEGTAALLFRAVVEGDASRVETAYALTLSGEEQQALAGSKAEEIEQATADLKDVPTVLMSMMSAPYALGEPLVTLAAAEGNAAVDEMFQNPPRTEEHLLDPFVTGTDAAKVIEVAAPELAEGEERFDGGEFGALMWLMVLAERVPLLTALDAADGWGGDQYIAFERGEVTCIRASFVGDTDEDTLEMREALDTWADALPAATTEVRSADGLVHLDSCDPGGKAAGGSDSSEDALTVAAVRSSFGATLVAGQGLPSDSVRCFTNGLVREFTIEELTATEVDDPQELQRRMQETMAACLGA